MARLRCSRAKEADPISKHKAIGDNAWPRLLGTGVKSALSESYSNFVVMARDQLHACLRMRTQVGETAAERTCCFSIRRTLRGVCLAVRVRLLYFVFNNTRHRRIGDPSPTTAMNTSNQNRKTTTKAVPGGLDFGAKPNPWDLEFPDSPATAFRLWALKYFGRHFHEVSVQRLERSMGRRRASSR